jgi:hypothetical protein
MIQTAANLNILSTKTNQEEDLPEFLSPVVETARKAGQ